MRALIVVFVLGLSFQALAFPNPFAPEEKEWTFLVFLNGHNNLDSFGKKDINEMENVGSTKDVNIVVQWASLSNKTTQRLYIKKDKKKEEVTSKVIMHMQPVDMGDYKNLASFIAWGAKKYPAKKYAVIVWNHGGGWHFEMMGSKAALKSNIDGTIHMNDISWDDLTGHFISTTQLGLAMDLAAKAIGRKIDIVGNDACLMAMPEVTFQMKNSVNYFVGSEEVEPGDGWPYTEVLAALTKNPVQSAAQFSKAIVEEYVKSYSKGGSASPAEVTQSALELTDANIYGLAAAIRELGQSIYMLNAEDKIKVREAISSTLTFQYSDYADLVDFANKLEAKQIASVSLLKSIAYVKAAVSNFVWTNGNTPYFAAAHGISIWLPSTKLTYSKYMTKYADLDFNRMTGWATSLQSVIEAVEPPVVEETPENPPTEELPVEIPVEIPDDGTLNPNP